MNKLDLSQPQHQELSAVLVYMYENFRAYANFLLYALIAVFIDFSSFWWLILVVIFGGGLVLIVFSWLQYQRFTFHISGNELVIQSGVLVRERTTISFERIQSVHLHENFMQRILDITGLKIDTAGSQAKELEIKALEKPYAYQLQEALQPQKAATSTTDEPTTEATTNSHILVKLGLKDFLKVALTDNHFRNGALVASVMIGFLVQLQEIISTFYASITNEVMTTIMQTGIMTAFLLLILFLIVTVMVSLVSNILNFYDFESSLTDESFKVKGGLIKRNEYTIPYRKIQLMEWRSNFMRDSFGMKSVQVYQGQSASQDAGQNVVIPACYEDQTTRIMDTLFPEWKANDGYAAVRPDNFYMIFLFNIFAIPGIIAAALVGYFLDVTYAAIGFPIYAGLVALYTTKFVKSVSLETNGELIYYKRGWLFPKSTVLKPFKIQAVELHQNFLQKRRHIAHLSFHTAAGFRTIRFLPIQEAKKLYDLLLYKVEVYKGSWM